MTELANAIEAILFYQAEPMTVKRLTALLKQSEEQVREALRVLDERLSVTGLRLLQAGEEVVLGTAPFASALIEAITKDELSKDLSKASLETLAIVLYKGPITRAEIDYIRGVNSTFILRNLLVRGLVEKIDNPTNQRSFLYKPTFQLLEYMGVSKVGDLPEYNETLRSLEGFIAAKDSTSEMEIRSDNNEIPSEGVDGVQDEDVIASDLDDALLSDLLEDFPDDELADLEADIAEEDVAGKNFVDDRLEERLQDDVSRI